jgi:ubiquinone/menaquinone biosynthesis C-methylase UbiE
MDYDRTTMPEAYDRGRKPPDGVLDMWMDRIAAALAGHKTSTIVDLGCGTGRFSDLLAERFGANVVGVDPSQKMLAQAREKSMSDRVTFMHGTGEAIPCADASADLVFMSMAFHHFASPAQAATECRRVLRNGGMVCVRNSTRDRSSPYEAFFPNYRSALDILRPVADIVAAFTKNGFKQKHHEVVPHVMARDLQELAEKASHRADSTLVRLSDADFEHGLAKMRAAPATSEPAMIEIDLLVFARE